MLIDVIQFAGELPIAHPTRLPTGYALKAENTRIENGTLTPFAAPRQVTTFDGKRPTIYLRGSTWLAWDEAVNVVPGPIADDRLYITGDGAPKMQLADGTSYNLALPAPTRKPDIEALGEVDADAAEDVVFAYTWVTELDEESPPSPLSNVLLWSTDIAVRLDNFGTPPAGRMVDRIRIYRSQTGTTGRADLFYVDEIPWPASSYDYANDLAPIQNVIPTLDYDPPRPGMKGLIALPNGIMAAFAGKRLLFSEPYLPHAWPAAYELTVDYDIVGLAAFGTFLAVLTKGTPYRAQGTHPETMALEKIEQNLPCLSARGIVDLGYAAAYPSADGLVLIEPQNARLVTSGLFSRAQWRAMKPKTFVAERAGRGYLFFTDGDLPNGERKAGIIDVASEMPSLVPLSVDPVSLYHDLRTSELYYQDATDNALHLWDDVAGDARMSYIWQSPDLDLPVPVSFAAVEISGHDGTVALDIYADGRRICTIDRMHEIQRVPAVRTDRWHLVLRGTATVYGCKIGTSVAELAKGST